MTPPRIGDEGRRALVLGLVGLGLVQAAAAAGAALSMRLLFQALHGELPQTLPWAALAGLGLSGAVIALARFGFFRLGERLGQAYAQAVRKAIFDHGSRQPQAQVEARRAGYQSLRFVGDLSALKDWPARGIPALVQALVVVPAVVVCLFLIDPGFGWAGLGLALVSLAGLGLGLAPMLRAHRRLRARRALLAADLTERLALAPSLAALGRRAAEQRLLARRSDSLTRAALRRVTVKEALRSLPETLTALAAALVFWLGFRAGADSGTIAAGLALLGLAARPLRGLTDAADRASAFRTAHRKLTLALARPERAPQGEQRLQRGPIGLELQALHVNGQGPFDLTLAPGARGTLPPGLDPEALFRALIGQGQAEGTIRLNGTPVQDLSAGSLRRGVARIGDAPVVLKGSLRRALTLGLTERPSDAEITARLGKQGLGAVLEALGPLDRRLSEGARSCTRAERLAISVLQAALQRPGLVIIAEGMPLPPPARTWAATQRATLLETEDKVVKLEPSRQAKAKGAAAGG